MTERPEINDGYLIYTEIRTDTPSILPDGRYIFNNVSIGADLYWRFQAWGVYWESIVCNCLCIYM